MISSSRSLRETLQVAPEFTAWWQLLSTCHPCCCSTVETLLASSTTNARQRCPAPTRSGAEAAKALPAEAVVDGRAVPASSGPAPACSEAEAAEASPSSGEVEAEAAPAVVVGVVVPSAQDTSGLKVPCPRQGASAPRSRRAWSVTVGSGVPPRCVGTRSNRSHTIVRWPEGAAVKGRCTVPGDQEIV